MSYFGNINIHGSIYKQCRQRINNCLQRLKKFNLKAERNKYKLFQEQISILGIYNLSSQDYKVSRENQNY